MAEAKIVISAQDRATAVLGRLRGEIGRMQNSINSILGPLGVGFSLSLGAAALAVKNFAVSIGDLGDAAAGLGTSALALAELRSKAAEAGVEASVLDNALGKLNNKITDAVRGNKQAVATFEAMGVAFKDLSGNARPTEQVLADISDRMKTYANTAERGALLSELFGERIGRRLAEYLIQGSDGLRQFTGLTKETIAEAKKLDEEIDKLATSWERLKNSILGKAVPAVNALIDAMRRAPSAAEDLSRLRLELERIDATLAKYGTSNALMAGNLERRQQLVKEIAAKEMESATEARRLLFGDAGYGERRSVAPRVPDESAPKAAAKAFKDLASGVDDYERSLRRAMLAESDRRGVEEINALAAAERNRIVELDRLLELEGALTSEQLKRIDIWQELRAAGRITDEGYVKLMEDLLGKTREMVAETEKLNEVAKDFGFTFSSALEDIIVNGGSARDVIRSLEQDIIRMVTRLLVTEPMGKGISGAIGRGGATLAGGGSFFDSFADAFIKMFGMSSGGPVMGNHPYLVGEKGPELFVPRTSGQILPNGKGRSTVININVPQSTSGATAQQIAATVARTLAIADARLN